MQKKEDNTILWTILGIGMLVILLIAVLLTSNIKDIVSIDATDPIPGIEDELTVLDPSTQTTYSENSCKNIIDSNQVINNLFLDYNPDLGDPDPQDDETIEDEEHSELIEDNYICTKYWKFTMNYNNLDVCVDANEGEIIMVQNCIMNNGEFSLENAITAGQDIINSFCPSFGVIQPAITSIDLSSSDDGVSEETITGYELIYRCQYQGVDTTDQIFIEFDSSGSLVSYIKVWNMKMPTSTTPLITSTNAIDTAKNYLEYTGNAEASLMIVRPNYYWQGEGPRYGFSQGVLCWVVTMDVECEDEGETYYYTIGCYVNAINGEIVGGF